MSLRLKPIDQQVIVITGASSGIGLATAELAAKRGAKLVLAARSESSLQDIVNRIRSEGGAAIAVTCDVADARQVEHVAQAAIQAFGGFDTWVNNAGVSIYGWIEEVSEEDCRRLFDTNFWGVFHGSRVAMRHLKSRGGALINVGSEVSEAVIPLQGMYAASKHAVKGFTDALRVEAVEVAEAPVSITLIQPTAVDTPFPQHARNYMDREPKLPEPQIDPSDVAEAILDAAVNPTRVKKVGAMAKLNTTISKISQTIGEKMSASYADRQQYEEPPRNRAGALHQPSEMTAIVGQTHGAGGEEGE